MNLFPTQLKSSNQTPWATEQCIKRCFVLSVSLSHKAHVTRSFGGSTFLLLRLTRVGMRSSNIFHESATLDSVGLFHNWVNTLCSSSPQVFSKMIKVSNLAYMDLTVNLPCSSRFHTHPSCSSFHTWPSKSSNNLSKRFSSHTKKQRRQENLHSLLRPLTTQISATIASFWVDIAKSLGYFS